MNPVWEAVRDRDQGCALQILDSDHRCFGRLTPHHLHKASQGGQYTAENLLTLCAGGNDWVEDHPAQAKVLGLVVCFSIDASEAARRREHLGWRNRANVAT